MQRSVLAWMLVAACSSSAPTHHEDGSNDTHGGTPNDSVGDGNGDAGGLNADGGGPDASAPDASDPYDGAFVDTKEVDDYLMAQMKAANAPGMAVALVKGTHIGWAKGYGFADLEKKTPVTPDTLFMLASISKTIVSVALMRLLEDPARGISLDDDVGTILPFSVRNPRHLSTPITYRMLLTHSSSLLDGAIMDVPPVQGDPTESLQDWLADAVTRADAWSTETPGTKYSYSNTGASLLGYLVELISGKSLEDYCQAEVWTPIGMNETSWFLRGLDPTHIAMPYEYVSSQFQAQGQYGYPDYPDGELRTSALQLARFLIMFMQRGEYAGARILKQATVDEMRRPQIDGIEDGQGLIWFYSHDDATSVLGHNGAFLGVSTDMWFDPATNAGYVLLTNGGTYMDDYDGTTPASAAMSALNVKLMDLAHALP